MWQISSWFLLFHRFKLLCIAFSKSRTSRALSLWSTARYRKTKQWETPHCIALLTHCLLMRPCNREGGILGGPQNTILLAEDCVIIQDSPEKENKENYYKKLAHMIMVADKSHDLSGDSASWRPRSKFQCKGQQAPDPGRADVSTRIPRQEKANAQVQRPSGRRNCPLFEGRPTFCSMQAFNWLDEDHPH